MKRFLLLLFIAIGLPAHAAPDGAALYDTHCSACHGDAGRGGVGVPLALESFLATVDDAYLHKTIRHGRPGRVMPAFGRFGDDEIAALVSHIRSWSDGPAPTFETGPVQGDRQRGALLFQEHCAECHGNRGEGGTGTGVTFSRPRGAEIIAPALNNPGFLASASDAMMRNTLVKGRTGTPMPPFLERGLSESDLNDVVAFVRSFEDTPIVSSKSAAQDTGFSLVYKSSYDFETTLTNLRSTVVGKNFRLIREQFLEADLAPAGQEDRKQAIVYFCNFKFLYDALAIDPRVGLFLPCRVTVVEREGEVSVMSMNPALIGRYFNNTELDQACDEMERIYREILEEAVL